MNEANQQDRGPWMQTATGRQWFLRDPHPEDVSLVDIAVALSRIPRYCGHTHIDCYRGYSVAQHSLMVADAVSPEFRLEALLHDAHEAYLGDWITPLKAAMFEFSQVASAALGFLEHKAAQAIHQAFGLEWPLPDKTIAAIKTSDLRALMTEKRDLLCDEPAAWDITAEPYPEKIKFIYSCFNAQDKFIAAVEAELLSRGLA